LTSQQQQDRELDELKAELQRRRKYVREAKKMSDIVSGLMAKRGYGQIKSAEKLAEAWKAVAGRMARRSRPGNLRRGVLEITVASSAVMQELVFQKKTLLKKLAAHSGLNIKDLRFRVGSVA
jgi:predicted nucleic acid-binding Zn ribbon protein